MFVVWAYVQVYLDYFRGVSFLNFVACLGMEGCCAVEREVERVLTKFNTTQQVMVVTFVEGRM